MTINEFANVFALGERLFPADKWTTLYRTWDEYEVLNNYIGDPETCLVAEVDDQIVGFALGTMIEKPRSAWTYGYLVWFGVDDTYRKQGIASNLLEHRTEEFIAQGARMMIVDSALENEGAVTFFEKNGFGNPQAHVYLSRNLTNHPRYE